MRHYAKLLRATLTASLMLVATAGAAVAGPFEDATPPMNAATTQQQLLACMTVSLVARWSGGYYDLVCRADDIVLLLIFPNTICSEFRLSECR